MSEEIKQSDQEILKNAMANSALAFFNYFYENKDNISKTDLFKVMLASGMFGFNVEFPKEVHKFLYNEEKATEIMKNIMAFQLHMKDISYNKLTREVLEDWKKSYLEENKGEENE